MGFIYADIELVNTKDLLYASDGVKEQKEIQRLTVRVLVDSGAYNLSINEHILAQLGLPFIERREFEMANGEHATFPIVGPVEVRFGNRNTTTRAIVLPGDTEPLLGSIPLEDLDVVLDHKAGEMRINPANPYMAQHKLKLLTN